MPDFGQDTTSGRWKNLNNLLLAKTMPPPLRCCCSVTCPLQHSVATHWQHFFPFQGALKHHSNANLYFCCQQPHLWRIISSTVCVKQKAPNHCMHVTALLYKGMMSTPPFQTPAVSVYLLDHPHVSLRQNSFYKKSRRGFCHESHEQRSCTNCLGSDKIVKNLRKQLPFLCNWVNYYAKHVNLFKTGEGDILSFFAKNALVYSFFWGKI